jgi:transposase-like protein
MKSQRRKAVDDTSDYRNGHGKPRKLTVSNGTIELRRPRVRGLEARFESRILPLFKRRTPEVSNLLPELYLHGLSCGDFDLALRGLLGQDAPLSASTIARLKEKWHSELGAWKARRLDDLSVVYVWADGVYIKAGLEKDKSCLLVMIAALVDGSKMLLAIDSGHRESTESWSSLLRSLRDRGLKCPKAVVGDGALGLWAGLRNVYPEAKELRCWNHRIMNIVDRVKKVDQATAVELLRKIAYAADREEAQKEKKAFQGWCEANGYRKAAELMDEDWGRMMAFFDFPKEHWQHLRTTNPVESPFAALRLRTNAAKRFKKAENATCVVWKMLTIAQSRFRRLNAPELLGDVWKGVEFVDGVRKTQAQQETYSEERIAA